MGTMNPELDAMNPGLRGVNPELNAVSPALDCTNRESGVSPNTSSLQLNATTRDPHCIIQDTPPSSGFISRRSGSSVQDSLHAK